MINLDAFTKAKLKLASRAFDLLARYCALRERSIGLKEGGMHSEAQHVERKLDDIYRELPRWAQWAGFERTTTRMKTTHTINLSN